jgi:hypothetical protein
MLVCVFKIICVFTTSFFFIVYQAMETTPPSKLLDLISQGVDAVCFDVDSTLCPTEGIDELAAFLGVGEEVAAVTREVRV